MYIYLENTWGQCFYALPQFPFTNSLALYPVIKKYSYVLYLIIKTSSDSDSLFTLLFNYNMLRRVQQGELKCCSLSIHFHCTTYLLANNA